MNNRTLPQDCAWEAADGEPVAVRVAGPPQDLGDACQFCGKAFSDEPQPEQPSGVDPERFIDAILTGAASAAKVGEHVVMLAFLLKQAGADIPSGPASLRELAAWLGVSHPTAAARLTTFKAGFAAQTRCLLTSRPHR